MIFFRKIDLFEDAVFYRDVTQWLRQKRIHLLLVGLMTLGLACVLAPGTFSTLTGQKSVGLASLSMLVVVYCLYGLLLLSNTGSSIGQEFSTNTYELYEVTGLKPEDMMRGHMLSAGVFLLVGLAVLMPYGVVSWMLGGVDFTLLFFLIVLALILIPPIVVVIVTSAYSMRRKSGKANRQVPGGVLIFVGLMFLPGLISGLSHMPGMNPVGFIFNAFLKSPLLFLLSTFLGLAMYSVVLLLFFYQGSHKLCRPCDTRIFQIQTCVAFIAVIWGLFCGFALPLFEGGLTLPIAIAAYFPLGIVIIMLLTTTISGQMHPPQAFAFRYRYKDGTFEGCAGQHSRRLLFQRWCLNRFGPAELTARKQIHFMLGFSAFALALGLAVNVFFEWLGTGSKSNLDFMNLLDIFSLLCFYCLFVPLFPSGLYQNPQKPRKKSGKRLILVLLTWIFLFLLLGGGWMLIDADYISEKNYPVIKGLVIKSTLLFLPSSAAGLNADAWLSPFAITLIRFSLGIMGYVMLTKWLAADVIRERIQKVPPALPADANKKHAVPPPLSGEQAERS